MSSRTLKGFFSPKRFGQLLLRDVSNGYRGWLIAAAAVAGVVILLSVITGLGPSRAAGSGSPGVYGLFFPFLFIGGFISTSFAFRELRDSGTAISFLTLPASTFEKFASKLLVTTVGFTLGSLLFFTAVAAVSEGLNALLFGAGRGMLNPFAPDVLRAAGTYMLAQSVFFLGSIWFRKAAFVKTVLWLCVAGFVLAAVAGVAGRLVLPSHFATAAAWGGRLSFDGGRFLGGRFAPGGPGYAGLQVFKTIASILCYVLPVASWCAAYFRLGETEV
jgi:hypothetical protein